MHNRRSPIQAHFAECLQGTATIRAFRAEQRFIVENDARVDVNSSAVMSFTSAGRWLQIRVETLGAIVVAATALLCWGARDSLSGALAG